MVPGFGEISAELMNRATPIFLGVTPLTGLILVSISFVFPWVALLGYGLYVVSNINPFATLKRARRLIEKILIKN
jgi:hypothetical protein